jgi:phosphate transport system protein
MIRLSIKAFTERNIEMASKLTTMDDVVDDAYLDFVKRSATSPDSDVKCMISGTLILRYLERIADHATYVGESVAYIVSGERAARK